MYAGGKTAMTAVMLWLLVGVYGNILKAGHIAVELAMDGIAISKAHGINGLTPEDTMRNMGLIASPGMVKTEGTIVDIMRGKGSAQ